MRFWITQKILAKLFHLCGAIFRVKGGRSLHNLWWEGNYLFIVFTEKPQKCIDNCGINTIFLCCNTYFLSLFPNGLHLISAARYGCRWSWISLEWTGFENRFHSMEHANFIESNHWWRSQRKVVFKSTITHLIDHHIFT